MTVGLLGNGDGSAAIQVGGSDAIQISTGRNITIPQNLAVVGNTTFTGTTTFSSGLLGVNSSVIQPINATVASNAMTITLNPTTLSFRSQTAGSGTVSTRTISSPLSITVPTSATLATVSNIQSKIVVLCIDNSGTPELAVVNISGGLQIDETNLISTTIISSSATSDAVYYSSTNTITSMPYRVVGYVESTQTTAGTWAAAPTNVQGVGGQALVGLGTLGYGQSYFGFVIGSTRVSGTTYYNTTGRPILVMVTQTQATAGTLAISVNGIPLPTMQNSLSNAALSTFIVPPNQRYVVTTTTTALAAWSELR